MVSGTHFEVIATREIIVLDAAANRDTQTDKRKTQTTKTERQRLAAAQRQKYPRAL